MSRPDEHAPGLEKRRRADGRIACYWRAKERFTAAGYTPAIVSIPGDWNDPADRPGIIDHCRRLEAEMRAYMDGEQRPSRPPGTIAWLCEQFQSHDGSPYRTKRADTQRFYDTNIRAIVETVGQRRAADITGPDVRRWHQNWAAPVDGGAPRLRRAKAMIQTLRVVLAFGVELKDRGAIELSAVLRAMRFESPARRASAMTADHVAAICATARDMGAPSIARAVAVQYWTALRQRDVIGEWIREEPRQDGAIRQGPWRWTIGLTWGDHIDPVSLALRKPTSKSNGKVTVEHDLREVPDVIEQFSDVPLAERIGPVIIDERTGLPYLQRAFTKRFRAIADAAGVPAGVWNMDARAGAITDALNAAADPVAVMKAAGHTQLATTMGYNRGQKVQSIAVARARLRRDRTA